MGGGLSVPRTCFLGSADHSGQQHLIYRPWAPALHDALPSKAWLDGVQHCLVHEALHREGRGFRGGKALACSEALGVRARAVGGGDRWGAQLKIAMGEGRAGRPSARIQIWSALAGETLKSAVWATPAGAWGWGSCGCLAEAVAPT